MPGGAAPDDERVLKPRVAGFLAVGGSLTSQWKTLTLPLMHTATFSMQIAVVDQVQFGGAGTPRSILLDEAARRKSGRRPNATRKCVRRSTSVPSPSMHTTGQCGLA
jgi:hypothetical protein